MGWVFIGAGVVTTVILVVVSWPAKRQTAAGNGGGTRVADRSGNRTSGLRTVEGNAGGAAGGQRPGGFGLPGKSADLDAGKTATLQPRNEQRAAPADPHADRLVRELSHEMPFVAARAAKALGASGRPDAVPPLIWALENPHRSVRFAVVEGLLALGALSLGPLRGAVGKERDPEVRQLMGSVLAQLERVANGQQPVPTGVLLPQPPELIDEIGKDIMS
jgi:hypothetical protein